MPLDEGQKSELSDVSKAVLDALDSVVQAAKDKLAATRPQPTTDVLAYGGNTMVGGHTGAATLTQMQRQAREQLQRLLSEPFVARVEVDWEGEQHGETIFFSRTSAADVSDSIPGARIVAYGTPLGRLAEHEAGASVCVYSPIGVRRGTVQQRLRLRPALLDERWDGLDSAFEFDGWTVALESLRRYLEQIGRLPSDVVDLIADLLAHADEARTVRQSLRRKVVDRIALRDQPVLDKFQGAVFRLPLNQQLMLLGPPGTGKTTTLIRRLAQKRIPETLTDDERATLERAGLSDSFYQTRKWAMFSPTELLKLYLREAFNRESVPASDENLKTWDKERLVLGRRVLRVLRSADAGLFQLDESADTLLEPSSKGLTRLFDAFSSHHETSFLQRLNTAAERLRQSEHQDSLGRTLVAIGSTSSRGGLSLRNIATALLRATDAQPELKQFEDNIRAQLQGLGNDLLRRHPGLLTDVVSALPQLLADRRSEEDDENDDDYEEPTREPNELGRDAKNDKGMAVTLLLRALRLSARNSALGRSSVGGRSGRVLEIQGDRRPHQQVLSNLGRAIISLGHGRTLVQSPKHFVMSTPRTYGQFRRLALSQERFFARAASEAAKNGVLSAHEADIVILTMLRNVRRLFETAGWTALGSASPDWLEEIKSEYLLQVFVDEAPDFSPIQLACMLELSHPRLRSWFACGDYAQRVTDSGIQDDADIDWVADVTSAKIERNEISISYRQSTRLRALVSSLSSRARGPEVLTSADATRDEPDIWPLLAENTVGDDLGVWLADRIVEIERSVGSLPSIAVFVDGDAAIDPIVNSAREPLAVHNIRIVGCKEGRVVGDALEVRVFDVRHIKGLEFEAVFFVGIDSFAAHLPTLFDRFFYVGVSRAATYLGVTCVGTLPPALEPARRYFDSGTWQS